MRAIRNALLLALHLTAIFSQDIFARQVAASGSVVYKSASPLPFRLMFDYNYIGDEYENKKK